MDRELVQAEIKRMEAENQELRDRIQEFVDDSELLEINDIRDIKEIINKLEAGE